MAPKYLIYGLIDPRNAELRYVGKSSSGLNRPSSHMCPSILSKNRSYSGCWLRQLQAEGLKPEIEVLETHEKAQDLPEAEQFWIAYYKSIGCRLTNLTAGGEGRREDRGWHHSPEVRKKISEAQLGRTVPLERRERIAAALKGRPISLHRRQNLLQFGPQSTEKRHNISKSMGGRAFIDQFGNKYHTLSEASKQLNLHRGTVCEVLHGKRSHTKGYSFKYAE